MTIHKHLRNFNTVIGNETLTTSEYSWIICASYLCDVNQFSNKSEKFWQYNAFSNFRQEMYLHTSRYLNKCIRHWTLYDD